MKVKVRSFRDTETSIIGLVESSLRRNWDKPAYTDYGTQLTYTYSDVARRIAALHRMYADMGIKPGDHIALCDRNNSNWAVSFLSILTYGAVAVPILPDFHPQSIQSIFEHSESVLMIGGAEMEKLQMPVLRITDWSMQDGSRSIAQYMQDGMTPADVKYFDEDPEGLALMSYTSGSTGDSKGVMLPYRSIWSNVMFADEVLGLENGSRTMAILPMSHMYGFAFDFIYEFCCGCHVHYLTKTPSPAIIVKAFGEVKPAIVIAVPLIIEKIVTLKVFPTLRTPKMRFLLSIPGVRQLIYSQVRKKLVQVFGGEFYEVIVGGAAFSREVEDFLHKIHFPYTVGYGMTECGPILGYEDWHDFVQYSCGKAAPRMEIRIDSSDPEHEAGEILARGTNTMLGYYKNPEGTNEAIDSDGWLHTGDLGTMDRHGNIFIRGRKKTMLLGANGQNIYPEEIEDVILTNSMFDECVVVQRGEKIVALAYISEDTLKAQGKSLDDVQSELGGIRRQLNTVLPKFANLAGIELRDTEFEKTPKRSIRRFLYS